MTGLVVGLGTAHGDDGIGLAVARRIAATTRGVDVVETDDPAGLLDIWAGRDDVVVVDALSSGGAPGSIVTVDAAAASLPRAYRSVGGTHALGLSAAVELARALGRLPAHLVVVGVEVATTAPGADMSEAVASAAGPAAAAALGALASGRSQP